MKAEKTTFEVEGINEPCILVKSDDDFVQVRISTSYHYYGPNQLFVAEYLDGDFNSMEEIMGDFKSLTLSEAKQIAKQHSAYLR